MVDPRIAQIWTGIRDHIIWNQKDLGFDGSSLVVQWVKDVAMSLQPLRSMLWLGFELWCWNFQLWQKRKDLGFESWFSPSSLSFLPWSEALINSFVFEAEKAGLRFFYLEAGVWGTFHLQGVRGSAVQERVVFWERWEILTLNIQRKIPCRHLYFPRQCLHSWC